MPFHAEAAGDRRANLVFVQILALNLACFDNIVGEGLEDGLLPQREPQRFHMTYQPALPMTNSGQFFRQFPVISVIFRPIWQRVAIDRHSPHDARQSGAAPIPAGPGSLTAS